MNNVMTMALPAMLNETYKGLILRWSYRFNLLTEALTFLLLFVGISFFMGRGELARDQLAWSLIGFIIWYYAVIAISNMSWNLREETQTGTLEQMYMSPVPMGVILLGRTLSTLLITTATVLLVALPVMAWLNFSIPLRWAGLPVFALTLAGLYGFGFLVGGATLVFKQVEALSNLLTNLLLFFNGSFVAVSQMAGWMESISLWLPSTQGIIVLRNVLLEGQSLGAAWADGSLVALVVNTAVYFFGGLLVFRVCEYFAQRNGSLGQY